MLSLAVLAGCSDSDSVGSASGRIGPAGGNLQLNVDETTYDFSINIPEGALDEELEIGVEGHKTGIKGLDLDSYIFDMSPDGLQFHKPVTIAVHPKDGFLWGETNASNGRKKGLYLRTSDGDIAAVSAVRPSNGNLYRGDILHFSQCFVAFRERGTSFCAPPVTPDITCHITGGTQDILWGISEIGADLDPEGGCTQPITSVAFSSSSTELFYVITHFTVSDAVNVISYHKGQRLFGDGDGLVLPPPDFGNQSFRDRLAALPSSEPRTNFWTYGPDEFAVWPEDDTKCMQYSFCLGVRTAGTQTTTEICGSYDSCVAGKADGDGIRGCEEDGFKLTCNGKDQVGICAEYTLPTKQEQDDFAAQCTYSISLDHSCPEGGVGCRMTTSDRVQDTYAYGKDPDFVKQQCVAEGGTVL